VLSTLTLSSAWMSAWRNKLWLLVPVTERLESGTTVPRTNWLLTSVNSLKKKLSVSQSTPQASIWSLDSPTTLECSTSSKLNCKNSRRSLFLGLARSSSLTVVTYSPASITRTFRYSTSTLASLLTDSYSNTIRILWRLFLGWKMTLASLPLVKITFFCFGVYTLDTVMV